MSDRSKVVGAVRVLYGPDGQPLPEDERSDWQRHWDRQFRAAMGQSDTPLARAMRQYMERRDRDHAEELAKQQSSEGKLGPSQQAISDEYDQALDRRKSREHKKVYSLGKADVSKDEAK